MRLVSQEEYDLRYDGCQESLGIRPGVLGGARWETLMVKKLQSLDYPTLLELYDKVVLTQSLI